MRNISIAVRVLLIFSGSLLLPLKLAWAGPYGDSLGKCFVESTTSAEKTALVRWMFVMMTLHPDVQDVSSVTPDQRTAATKDVAHMFQRLLTESCMTEAKQAIKYEGASTLEASFSLLGQVAARELLSNPAVAGGMSDLQHHIDDEKIKKALEDPQER